MTAVLLLSMVCLSSCGKDGGKKVVFTTGLGKDEVFRIGNITCTDSEMMLYLTNTQNQYENVYGEGIWNTSVDGVILEEDYINNLTTTRGGMEFPLTVEEGCVFAMGDNRMVSRDSRYPEIGQIDEREILGKAIFLMIPGTNKDTKDMDFSRIGVIK